MASGLLLLLLLLLLSCFRRVQFCATPIDGSPPGSPVPGILQARILEWVAIFFSNAWKWKVKVKSLSRVRLFATPWTAAHQACPSLGFSRQEYWSGVPLPSPIWPNLAHYFTANRWENVEVVTDFLFFSSKITVTVAINTEDVCFLAGKLWQT